MVGRIIRKEGLENVKLTGHVESKVVGRTRISRDCKMTNIVKRYKGQEVVERHGRACSEGKKHIEEDNKLRRVKNCRDKLNFTTSSKSNT